MLEPLTRGSRGCSASFSSASSLMMEPLTRGSRGSRGPRKKPRKIREVKGAAKNWGRTPPRKTPKDFRRLRFRRAEGGRTPRKTPKDSPANSRPLLPLRQSLQCTPKVSLPADSRSLSHFSKKRRRPPKGLLPKFKLDGIDRQANLSGKTSP